MWNLPPPIDKPLSDTIYTKYNLVGKVVRLLIASEFTFKILPSLYFRWAGPSVGQPDVELYVEEWCKLGVKYLGGCCGTSMETYQKMRSIVDAYNQKFDGQTDSFASR